MNAKCIGCKRMWNVSVLQKIPKLGYICPQCEIQKKLSMKKLQRFA